jgi:F-type H+-transporting ATPase subunit b
MVIALLAEAATHGGSAKPAFPPFETWHMPSQLFWLTILFATLYLVLSRMILPRLSDTLEKRSDRIASDLDEAQRLNDQATEAAQALELRMTQAKTKARETADKARVKMESEINAETARVDAEVDKKLASAEARISELRAEAMKNVEEIATETAQVMTSRFGLNASAANVKKAVADALK